MPEICLLPDGGCDAALILLKMLAILIFGSEMDIGLDTNFKVHSLTGKIQAITSDSKSKSWSTLLTLWLIEALGSGL